MELLPELQSLDYLLESGFRGSLAVMPNREDSARSMGWSGNVHCPPVHPPISFLPVLPFSQTNKVASSGQGSFGSFLG